MGDQLWSMTSKYGMIFRERPGQLFFPFYHPSIGEVLKNMYGAAEFSDDMVYRTRLIRAWQRSKGRVLFIMLNPSTATEEKLDPTIRRCLGFAYQWGMGEMEIRNLFAIRSASPAEMKRMRDPVGPAQIVYPEDSFDVIVAAWGNHGRHMGRGREVEKEIFDAGLVVHHLGLTRDGSPMHPLYLAGDTPLNVLRYDRKVKK
jgi:hypothetical protein